MIHMRYGPARNCCLNLRIDLHRLFIGRFRLMHDLDIERDYFDADFGADRNKSGGVNQPFIAAGHDIKFIVNAFKNQEVTSPCSVPSRRIDKFYIFRTDDNVDRLVIAESFVDTCPTAPRISTSSSFIMVPSMILLCPIKSATNAFSGSL